MFYLLIISFFLETIGVVCVQASPLSEYQVKAAFLYNFGKFITWPETVLPASGNQFKLCILGNDPFDNRLTLMMQGKTIQGKPVLVTPMQEIPELNSCHLLFISPSEQGRLAEIFRSLKGSNTLTVGEMPGFLEKGGMIFLYIEDNRVQFNINTNATSGAHLKISSQLINLVKAEGE